MYLELDSVNMCVSKYPISYACNVRQSAQAATSARSCSSCRYCASPFSIAVVCRSQRPKSRPAPGPPTPAGYTADSTLCRAARPSQAFPAPRRHRALISPGVGRRAAWRRLAAAHILAPTGLGRPADLSRSRYQATRGIGGQRARHIPWSLGPRSAASRSGWWRTRRNPCDRRLPSPHSGTTAPS